MLIAMSHLLAQATTDPAASSQPTQSAPWWDYMFYGNEAWRYAILLAVIVVFLICGRIIRFVVDKAANRCAKSEKTQLMAQFLKCLASPAVVAVCAAGVYVARFVMRFDDETAFSTRTYELWGKVSHAIFALAAAYFFYRLVDIVEYYLRRWTSKTDTSLDDMLVPIIRKSLRVFIAAVSILFIADNILNMELGTVLATAGIGGLAIALAAQETIANFFGSINIFADRPFQVGERIRVGGFDGPVEEVGIRSTRIRTLDGHLVTVPNSSITKEMVENIGKRPFIKRVANITITYDTPIDKVELAVQMIKDILAATPEINTDQDLPFRVYFNEFNACSLNILVIYWVKPPDYWLFQEVNQRVNLAIMRVFEKEGIEFAFPTQTLYLKKDD